MGDNLGPGRFVWDHPLSVRFVWVKPPHPHLALTDDVCHFF